jgi:hypothetical protein
MFSETRYHCNWNPDYHAVSFPEYYNINHLKPKFMQIIFKHSAPTSKETYRVSIEDQLVNAV